ncbi:MAG: gluconokinase [Flavobacteriaceae bacterium]|nr:gluconokinase [Flavobacteriaceae bacterium]
MGVSGCGKSTVGNLLSEKTGIPFFDGDDFHPESNINKMSSGIPLTDEDRQQWLFNLNLLAHERAQKSGAIIACSALKESYRKILRRNIEPSDYWIVLKGSQEIIRRRISSRSDHFMPSNLLQSQYDVLEIPEYGLHLDIEKTAEELVDIILKELHS